MAQILGNLRRICIILDFVKTDQSEMNFRHLVLMLLQRILKKKQKFLQINVLFSHGCLEVTPNPQSSLLALFYITQFYVISQGKQVLQPLEVRRSKDCLNERLIIIDQ